MVGNPLSTLCRLSGRSWATPPTVNGPSAAGTPSFWGLGRQSCLFPIATSVGLLAGLERAAQLIIAGIEEADGVVAAVAPLPNGTY